MLSVLSALILDGYLSAVVRADTIFDVTVDTSSLSPGGTYFIDFQLDTNGFVSGDNTVVISNFGFGSSLIGSPTPPPLVPIGAASGDLSSTVVITDDPSNPAAGTVNDFTEQFAPGDSLTFHVDLSTNVVDDPVNGLSADQFSFAIQDMNNVNLPTTNGLPNNLVVEETVQTSSLTSPDTPLPVGFDLITSPPTTTTQLDVTTATPVTILGQSPAVPEPATFVLFMAGLAGLAVSNRGVASAFARRFRV